MEKLENMEIMWKWKNCNKLNEWIKKQNKKKKKMEKKEKKEKFFWNNIIPTI